MLQFVKTDQGDGEVACALQRDWGDDDFAIYIGQAGLY